MVLLVIPTVFTVLPPITATAVLRAISTQPMSQHSVQDLQSYLFRAFLRRVNKRRKRDLSMAQALQIDALASRNSVDPRASLEQKILIEEFLMQCDPATGDMFWRRVFQNRWRAYIDCGDLQPLPPCGTGYAALIMGALHAGWSGRPSRREPDTFHELVRLRVEPRVLTSPRACYGWE